MESRSWSESAFITLTYSDATLPLVGVLSAEATLVPRDLQLFLKRLRKVIAPARVSYYAVGEYGRDGVREKCWNPHYHAIVFGLRTCDYGDSNWCYPRLCRCPTCLLLASTWCNGRVHAGTVTDKSIQYVAGYIVEKLRTEVRGDIGLRVPEFSRMSLRPAIGVRAMSAVARAVVVNGVDVSIDVPSALQHGRRVMPLGRTLVRTLRRELGRDERAPCVRDEKKLSEMRLVQGIAFKSGKSYKAAIVSEGDEKVRQIVSRLKIRERKKS